MAKFADWLSDIQYETVHGDTSVPDVREVVFDSRKAVQGTVFNAMKGANVDAHRFIPAVIAQGCQAIVIEEKLFGDCFETEDQRAGMGNFLEKDKEKKLKVVPFKNR